MTTYSITQEQLERLLSNNPLIKSEGWINPDEYGFSRTYAFTVRGQRYIIEWYSNLSNLYCGECMICSFQNVEYHGCYPNGFKNNLNFYVPDVAAKGTLCPWRTIAVIPVEEYPTDGK